MFEWSAWHKDSSLCLHWHLVLVGHWHVAFAFELTVISGTVPPHLPFLHLPEWLDGRQNKKKRRARRFLLCCFWPELISAQSNLAKNVQCWLQWPRIWGKSKAERIAPYATIKSKFRAKHRFCYHKNNIEYSHKILQILSSNIATTSCWKKCRNSFCLWIPATQNTISIVLKCFINNKKKDSSASRKVFTFSMKKGEVNLECFFVCHFTDLKIILYEIRDKLGITHISSTKIKYKHCRSMGEIISTKF